MQTQFTRFEFANRVVCKQFGKQFANCAVVRELYAVRKRRLFAHTCRPVGVQEVCAEPPPSTAGQLIHYRDPKFIIFSDKVKNIPQSREISETARNGLQTAHQVRQIPCKQFIMTNNSLANSL